MKEYNMIRYAKAAIVAAAILVAPTAAHSYTVVHAVPRVYVAPRPVIVHTYHPPIIVHSAPVYTGPVGFPHWVRVCRRSLWTGVTYCRRVVRYF